MLTHKNITDKHDRYLVLWALCELRSIKSWIHSECNSGYCYYPVHSRMYGTYDVDEQRLIRVEHWQCGDIKSTFIIL